MNTDHTYFMQLLEEAFPAGDKAGPYIHLSEMGRDYNLADLMLAALESIATTENHNGHSSALLSPFVQASLELLDQSVPWRNLLSFAQQRCVYYYLKIIMTYPASQPAAYAVYEKGWVQFEATSKTHADMCDAFLNVFPLTPVPLVVLGNQPCAEVGDKNFHADQPNSQEESATLEIFAGQPWPQITRERYRLISAHYGDTGKLSFLAEEAKRYYLPAFMRCSLEEQTADEMDYVQWQRSGVANFTEQVLYYLDYCPPWVDLSQGQKKAIGDYLHFIMSDNTYADDARKMHQKWVAVLL